jgi:phosphoglycerate kinase
MSLPTLADLRELGGGRVLLRLDLNVPVKNGVVQDATRIEASLPTLRWLLDRAGVVAACSHLGDAKGNKPDPALSLEPVAAALEAALGRPVSFVPDCLDPAAGKAAPGSLLLLENLRFHKGEKANDPEFAKQLAAPFTHYVNDAFGTAHRAHASVAAAPALFPPGRKAAGLLMEAEVAALSRMVHDPEQPYVAVVGGAKISTKTAPLEALLERVEVLLIGGGMANTMLLAQGRGVGRSLVEKEMLETAASVLRRAGERGVRLELPADVVVADAIASPTRVAVVAADAVPADMMIVDIGPSSRGRFAAAIAAARTVFWNGPMGVFETPEFAEGTMAVARALAASKAFTVVGGGESVMAVHRAGVADAIGHVSTGGGASLEYLTGEILPAIAAIEA